VEGPRIDRRTAESHLNVTGPRGKTVQFRVLPLYIYNINFIYKLLRDNSEGGTKPWTGPGRGARETTGEGNGMPAIASGASPGSFGGCRWFKHRAPRLKGSLVGTHSIDRARRPGKVLFRCKLRASERDDRPLFRAAKDALIAPKSCAYSDPTQPCSQPRRPTEPRLPGRIVSGSMGSFLNQEFSDVCSQFRLEVVWW
jgi:hypothetical protein